MADIALNWQRYKGTPYEVPVNNIWKRKVLPVNSDPTMMDSDNDGLNDDLDDHPLDKSKAAFLIYETKNTDTKLLSYGNSDDQPNQDFRYADKSLMEICSLRLITLATFTYAQLEMRSIIKMHSKIFADKEMDYVIEDMFDLFFSGKGGTYSNEILTNKARSHKSSIEYIEQTTAIINEWITNNKGYIHGLEYIEEDRDQTQMVKKMKDVIDPPSYEDILSGLGICVDGTFWNCQEMCSQRIPKILDRQESGSVMRELL